MVTKLQFATGGSSILNKGFTVLFICFVFIISRASAENYTIGSSAPYYIPSSYWNTVPVGGDTVFITSDRTKALKFLDLVGDESNPIVFINKGGQVQIDDDEWGAITFNNCKYIKISGTGHPGFKYGFLLAANTCGLAFAELSSDCEAEYIKINHDGFCGIMAKKDYGGNPPAPYPVFSNLYIHDCFIENVTEGMYLGETKSPGMEFRHVRVYNNIVRNTGRESIQVANMVEDIEIYNNTMLNAGNDNETYQGNLLQVGDNSVVKAYNNILIGAPSYGIISLGSGNNYFFNNYIAECKGVFIDDRDFTLPDSLIIFSGNYITDIINSEKEVVRNMNGENYLILKDNKYSDKKFLFYRNYFSSYTNYELGNNVATNIRSISFVDPSENNYALKSNNPDEYMNMGAPGGPEYFDYEEESPDVTPESSQIILSADMVVDEVLGGSYYSPQYLVDEQSYTPENGLHPASQNWKPYWNMDNGPYHVYIDLGQVYTLTNISLHDMHSANNLVVSVGEPNNWMELFTDSLDTYNTWSQHDVNVSTRYIRFSMYESVYAAINEIIVNGYSENDATEKSALLTNKVTSNSFIEDDQEMELSLAQNPVRQDLKLNLGEDLNDDFTIEIFSLSGKKLFTENYLSNCSSRLLLNISDFCLTNGMYILRYTNREGYRKSLKFIKQSF